MTGSRLFWTSTLDLSDYEGSSGEAIQHHLQLSLQSFRGPLCFRFLRCQPTHVHRMWSTMDSTTSCSTPPASSLPSANATMGECYINRLPVELLAAILEEHCVLEVWAPFIDSQVCRRWHETTRRWPRVWSYITMRSRHKPSLNRIKTLLKRSCDSPLHVNLDNFGFPPMKHSIILLFQCPVITRIQRLFLAGSLPSEIQIVGSMPSLRTLQFKKCNRAVAPKFLLGTKGFPLLDELVAHGTLSLPEVAHSAPVLLRTISFSFLRYTEWVKILLECRETLVEVFLEYCTPPPPAQIHLPNLKFLALSYMGVFRNDIVAPSLITFHEAPVQFDPPKLPFTFSSITEYAYQGYQFSVGDWPLWGEHILPKLERLVLWGPCEEISKVLWTLVSHPHSVPKLNTIELAKTTGHDLSHDQWAELEGLFVHTPLSSILERRTGSRASYAPLRYTLVRDPSIVVIHIHILPSGTLVSPQSVNNITSILVTRLI